MSEENAKAQQEQADPTSGKPLSWWHRFHGQPVMVQLRYGIEYMLVTAPNEPVIHPQAEQLKAEGKSPLAHIPVINGILHVEGNEDDFRLIVRTREPDPNKPPHIMNIVLHPDDASFITICEAANIVQPG